LSEVVKVLLFGAAADRAGTRQIEISVDDGTTLGDLWPALTDRYPELAPMRNTLAFAINREYARMHETISSGDEVAVLPPVSGG
jgi:molybdopterin converting factor subunit 1